LALNVATENGVSFVMTTAILFAFWLLLSGYLDTFHIVSGTISSMLVAYFSSDLLFPKKVAFSKRLRRFWRFLKYLPWLLYEVFKANLDVAYRVLHPRMPIDPRIIKFKPELEDDMAIATLANSITLTPGTVTLEADREKGFVVHAITKQAADALLTGEMAKRVAYIEQGGRSDD
jgi:multicomponent Na+:H+ antiporter subunit E